jgi:hypothetical protein
VIEATATRTETTENVETAMGATAATTVAGSRDARYLKPLVCPFFCLLSFFFITLMFILLIYLGMDKQGTVDWTMKPTQPATS